jgi:hypothetical protein
MASVSSVPSIEFTDAGVVLPSESDILAGVISDADAAFGGGMNPALETPQGQLSSSLSAVISDKNNQIAYVANMIDPQYSEGRWQDAIGRIYFLTRYPATSTSVQVEMTGAPGTVIPAGTLVRDTAGSTYAATGAYTIGSGSTVTGEFQNVETGPIDCAAGTVIKIYQSVAGLDAINNSAAGTLGQDAESRSDFEYRRQNSVAINADGVVGSIYASVFNVSDVLDCYVTENSTGSSINVGATNKAIAAHSVYVAVVGGVDADVAKAIWQKKSLGCDYVGNTTVSVTDESGYSTPYPTYSVKFQRPSSLAIKFAVSIVNSAMLPSDITDQVKSAIIARFNGTDGTARERIGATVYASRYYAPVASIASTVSLISIQVGTSTANAASVAVGIDQRPTITESNITVTLV